MMILESGRIINRLELDKHTGFIKGNQTISDFPHHGQPDLTPAFL